MAVCAVMLTFKRKMSGRETRPLQAKMEQGSTSYLTKSNDVLLVLRKVGLPAQKVPAPQAQSRRQADLTLR